MTSPPIAAKPASPPVLASDSQRGLWIGLLGIVMFGATLPMARLSVGTADAPQMSGYFLTFGRAALAAALSICYLYWTGARRPTRAEYQPLLITAAGVVFGFPLFTSLAMRHVEAVHASVIVGLLPLTTAAVGAVLQRQRPSAGFWSCAVLGAALVVVYVLLKSRDGPGGSLTLHAADLLLVAGVFSAAVGYAYGARLSRQMGAENVICWAVVIALPLTLPLTLLTWPDKVVSTGAWWGFMYAGVFSMWLGFFAWYRGLALGGTVRVSQVQLVQPFVSMLVAVPLLGESIDLMTILFAVAVIATVFASRKMRIA